MATLFELVAFLVRRNSEFSHDEKNFIAKHENGYFQVSQNLKFLIDNSFKVIRHIHKL
jgi:hypothetical protein